MVQTHNRRKRFRLFSWMVIIVLLVAVVVVWFFVWNTYFNDDTNKGDSIDASSIKTQLDNDYTNKDGTEEDLEPTKKEQVVQFEGGDPNEADELSGAISYAEVVGNEVIIRANIDQYLTEGFCELELLKNDAIVYNEKVGVEPMVSTAFCDGFNVSVSGFEKGLYMVRINVKADKREGKIMGEVNI